MISLLPFMVVVLLIIFTMRGVLKSSGWSKKTQLVCFAAGFLLLLGDDFANLGYYQYQCTFNVGSGINKILPSESIYSSSNMLEAAEARLAAGYEYVEYGNRGGGINLLDSSGLKYAEHPKSRVHVIYYSKRFFGAEVSGVDVVDTYEKQILGWVRRADTRGGWMLLGITKLLFGSSVNMSCVNNRELVPTDIVLVVAPPKAKEAGK